MLTNRLNWTTYFLRIAEAVAQRSTCPRGQVGAITVLDNRVLTTGYNGSLPGQPHCIDVGCDLRAINGVRHCGRTIHAELNAVAQAAKFGVSISGATIYVWDSLTRGRNCDDCERAVLAAGIVRVVYN